MALIERKLSELEWTLTGYIPFEWQLGECREVGVKAKPDVETIPATVPGSVQKALLDSQQIQDWNIGLYARDAEWVENRHWLYETKLPAEWFNCGSEYKLKALGLDHEGKIYLNGKCIYDFSNCHTIHSVAISPVLEDKDNLLQIMFECPPRWLGQFYWSSKVRDWKPRFNYTWDWVSRLVQVGIWDEIYIEQVPKSSISNVSIQTDYDVDSKRGKFSVNGDIYGTCNVDLEITLYNDEIMLRKVVSSENFKFDGFGFEDLDVFPWWPNNRGSQQLYNLEIRLLEKSGDIIDEYKKRIGFKRVQWCDCLDAPKAALPWICNINGEDIFLQGVNWTPIRPNFADVTEAQYKKRLELYKSIGINTVRVWGGYTLEKRCFYDMCDELGLLVWQDFPLSSSGIENYPPDDVGMVEQYLEVVQSYVSRLHHHASILLWCGGNELTSVQGVPLGLEHPMLKKAGGLMDKEDSQHRFVPTSPSGPSFLALKENFGKGEHWDVHGPWKVNDYLDDKWESYWQNDDALFRSEVGAPGPSSASLIRKYAGACDTTPELSNPLWRRTGWWLEIDQYIKENGSNPQTLEDYVDWGQKRQAKILCRAVESCKNRFPKCGGVILWMGHDSFPCAANTAIVDFEGNSKYAATELAKIFLS